MPVTAMCYFTQYATTNPTVQMVSLGLTSFTGQPWLNTCPSTDLPNLWKILRYFSIFKIMLSDLYPSVRTGNQDAAAETCLQPRIHYRTVQE